MGYDTVAICLQAVLTTLGDHPSAREIREALNRVLASRAFAGSTAHRAFLNAVVSHALANPDAPPLKEMVLGMEVFGRAAESFDPRIDPVVRVEARRIRARLGRYYSEEGSTETLVIDLPRGAYGPTFTRRPISVHGETNVGKTRPRPRTWRWFALGAALALVAAGGWLVRDRIGAPFKAPEVTIAVVPLANLTSDGDLEPFVDALTDEISEALARLSRARVAARTSAFSLKRTMLDARAIGQKLNVEYLLEGSVLKFGEGLKVNVQLTRTADGYRVWSTVLTTPTTDLYRTGAALGRTIVAGAADRLGMRAAPDRPRPRPNKAAWELYMRAAFAGRTLTPAGFTRGLELAEQSVQQDQTFAAAYLEAARLRLYRAAVGDGPIPVAELEIIRSRLDATARLEPQLAGLQTLRGAVATLYDLNCDSARGFYLRGLDDEPVSADSFSGYAGFLALRGLRNDADAYYDRAMALDPMNLVLRLNYAVAPYYAGDPLTALKRLRDIDDVSPNNPFVLFGLLMASLTAGDAVAAAAELEKAERIAPSWDRLPIMRALVDIGLHRPERALETLRHLDADYGKRHPFFLGLAYAWAAQVDPAVTWLRRAIASHDMYAVYIPVDPLIDPIRRHARFREVWDAMPEWTTGLPYPGPNISALSTPRAR